MAAMSSNLREAFLQELEEVQFKVHKLEAMAISAGWRDKFSKALQNVSDKVKEMASGGPFDAMHISSWLHSTYKVDVNKQGNHMEYAYKGHNYVIDSADGKSFTIQKGSESVKNFNSWDELKKHMNSLTISCSAASVDDVVRYSKALMQCQALRPGSRCGQLEPYF